MLREVIVAQLVERLIPTSKIRSSNPFMDEILSTTFCIKIEKTKIKKKGRERPIKRFCKVFFTISTPDQLPVD